MIAHQERAKDAITRKKELVKKRRAVYVEVFNEIVKEEKILDDLYKPLSIKLEGAKGALAKLKVTVSRQVDVGKWASMGESFIDLRKAEKLRGKGTLHQKAEEYMLQAWQKGSPDDVAAAMELFREEFMHDLAGSVPKSLAPAEQSIRMQDIAAWLYNTNHVKVEYGIKFDGVNIEQLSPGTRGIVLLLLYLVIDKNDHRPLIVDQPEENLDPQSVYEELVPHFKEASKRRQIILVTHNANLVVNTDADQVIVASAERRNAEGLPDISYQTGALENPEIRQAVCNILEGGKRAFLERERRYRFRWDDTINPQ